MITINRTAQFIKWLDNLKDSETIARIDIRIQRMRTGNFGDVKPVGEGISELRIHHGAGYRVYFKQTDKTIVLLLCGGNKSTQSKDIAAAKTLAKEI
jgi:putative addiction module killer protein